MTYVQPVNVPPAVAIIRADPSIIGTIGTASMLPADCQYGCVMTREITCIHGRRDVTFALPHVSEK